MKIILSAFSCTPNRGSEPGIGWGFFKNLSKNHNVLLLTRKANQSQIEAELGSFTHPELVDILYFDFPDRLNFYKAGTNKAHLYYFLWQIGIYFKVKKILRSQSFDLIHHITFGNFRTPSLLAFLDIPFIFGPVGGGEIYPNALREQLPFRYIVSDLIREIINRLSVYNPILNKMYKRSKLIFCRTQETKEMIPKVFHSKCVLELGVGIVPTEPRQEVTKRKNPKIKAHKNSHLKLLFVGRPAYWKGLNLIIDTYAELLSRDYLVSLTFIGLGNNRWPKEIASRLSIYDQIEWIDKISLEELQVMYMEHDLLFFPSLRELGGNAIIEAFANHLPVLCLDLGYGTNLVEQDMGIIVPAAGKSYKEVIHKIADKVIHAYQDKHILQVLAKNAKRKSAKYLYENIVARVYEKISSLDLTKSEQW